MIDHSDARKYLKIAQGNLEAAIKMLDDHRYCVDISNQILAVNALLNKANQQVLKGHMHSCIRHAFESDDEAIKEDKVDEVINLLNKVMR